MTFSFNQTISFLKLSTWKWLKMIFSLYLIMFWIWTLFKRDNFSTRIVTFLKKFLIVNRCVFVTRQNFNIRLSVFIHTWKCLFILIRKFSWFFIVIFLDEFKLSFVKRNFFFVSFTRLNIKRREIDWNFRKFVRINQRLLNDEQRKSQSLD